MRHQGIAHSGNTGVFSLGVSRRFTLNLLLWSIAFGLGILLHRHMEHVPLWVYPAAVVVAVVWYVISNRGGREDQTTPPAPGNTTHSD
jgi:hypothetical protein